VISSPSNYRDVQQELIAEIHRNSTWPVVVTVDGNIGVPEESDFMDRDGGFIILIPDGDIKSLKAEINGLAFERTKFTRLWNSKARFVVAGANEFSTLQQTDIFNYLSKFRVYNCIIVNKVNDVVNKECSRPITVNDVDPGMKLGVYTWFPYQSSDRCTEVNDITLLDSWVISSQGHFTKNTDLFPRKIRNNLNGCSMKAVIRKNVWPITTYYQKHTYSNGSVVTKVHGMELNFLMMVLKQMNMTFVHVHTPKGFEIGRDLTNNLTEAMISKDVYIALGSLGTGIMVDTFSDFSNSYFIMTSRWYVPCSDKYSRWNSIFRIFSLEVWLVLILSIVTAAISTTLVGRYSCTSEWQVHKTLTSSLTNVWAVLLGVALSTMPRTPSLRSLFFSWVCFSLAFNTVFQTFLTTFLIDSGYKTPIRNMDELFASGVKLYYYPIHNFIFEVGNDTEISKIRRNRANCNSSFECYNWAMYHKNISFFIPDLIAEFVNEGVYYLGKFSNPFLCRLENGMFYNEGLSFVMLNGDPLLKRVSEILDRLVEAGFYNFWISLEIHESKLFSRKIAIVNPLDGYYSLNLYHMRPAFYLHLMGLCLSAICFIFELFYNFLLSRRK